MALLRIEPWIVDSVGNFVFNTATVTSNLTSGNATLGNLAVANYFSGSGNLLSNVQGANITGQVSNALVSGTVYTAAQPNITSVGTLTSLTVTGNITSGNVAGGNLVSANYVSGNGSLLTALTGANVTGVVGNATHATVSDSANSVAGANVTGQVGNSLVAGTVYTAAQPNITSVGTLTTITTSGDGTIGGNLSVTGNLSVSGTVTTVNSTTVNINDINIVLANNATTAAQANGGGITINGASATMLYNNTSNAFVFSHPISANGSLLTSIAGANVTGFVPNANVANTAYAVSGSNVTGAVAYATTANSVAVANVTGIGNIATVNLDGNASNILYGNGTFASAPITYGNSNVALYLPTYTGNLSPGNLTISASNLKVSGGTSGYVLTTDGAGNLSWAAQSGGGGGGPTGSISVTVDTFTGDGTTTKFTLSTTPGSVNQTLVNYNGAMQLRNAYTLSGADITFSEAPALGSSIEITTTSGITSSGGNYIYRQYTGDGTTTQFTVTNSYDANSVLVTQNGVLQAPGLDYTVSSGTLTFLTAPTNGERIQIRELKTAIATAVLSPAGSNTNIQFNDAGSFGGSANITFDKTTNTLSVTNLTTTGKTNLNSVSNVTLTGGTSGQYLQTDGTGNVSWATVSPGTSNARNIINSYVFGS